MSRAYPFGFALSRATRGNLKFTNDCRRVFRYYVDISPRSESCFHRASLGIQDSCNLFHFSPPPPPLPQFPEFFNGAIPRTRGYVRSYVTK